MFSGSERLIDNCCCFVVYVRDCEGFTNAVWQICSWRITMSFDFLGEIEILLESTQNWNVPEVAVLI